MNKLFTAVFLSFFLLLQSNATNLITGFNIVFNWDPNSNQDAIPVFSENTDPDIFEYAYLFGSSPIIKLEVLSSCPNDFMLLIYAKDTQGNGFDKCLNYYNYTPGTEIEIDLDIPNYITKYSFTWEWIITAIPICNTGSGYTANTLTRTTEQHLYVILDEPHAPMNPPWAGVLEYACEWAEGEHSIVDATTKITEHLYTCGLKYDIAPHYTGSETDLFNIVDFLIDLADPQSKLVNCLDLARAIVLFSNGLGNSLIVARFEKNIPNKELFPVNYIDPIGDYDPTNNPFHNNQDTMPYDCRTGGFSFHAFAIKLEIDQEGNISLSTSKVWDATLRYDIDIDPDNVLHLGPPGLDDCDNATDCGGINTGEIWELPCNVDYYTYLNKIVDNWIKIGNRRICCQEPNNPDPCVVIQYPYSEGFNIEKQN